MKMKAIYAGVAAALLGASSFAIAQTGTIYGAPATSGAGGGVGGSAGGTGASPIDTPREAGRAAPGGNPNVTGPQGTVYARCDNLNGVERERCLRQYPSTGASTATPRGNAGVGGSAGGTGASPVDSPREAGRSAPGANPDITGPQGARR